MALARRDAWHSVRSTDSLRWRLPLWLSAIVVSAIAASLWTAHSQVERTLIRAGGERARAAADQLGGLLEGSTQQGVEQLRRAGTAVDLRRYLKDSSAANQEATQNVLRPLMIAGPRHITLWNNTGVSLLTLVVPA